MRLSDARVVLDDVHRRAREHLQASGGLGRARAGAGAGLSHVNGLEAAVAEDRDRARVRALCRQVRIPLGRARGETKKRIATRRVDDALPLHMHYLGRW